MSKSHKNDYFVVVKAILGTMLFGFLHTPSCRLNSLLFATMSVEYENYS